MNNEMLWLLLFLVPIGGYIFILNVKNRLLRSRVKKLSTMLDKANQNHEATLRVLQSND